MAREIKQGDRWFQTKSTELAAVLVALDFKFWDKDIPCDLREVNGEKNPLWLFEEAPEGISALQVMKAWKNADKYCEENPNCRVATAIAAVKNVRVFNEGVKNGVPLVGYQLGKNVMWVTKDSPKDKKLQKVPKAKKL